MYQSLARVGAKDAKKLLQESGFNERHVAGKEEDGVGAGAGKRRINAANRTAARDGIAAKDADGEIELRGDGADVPEHRAASDADAGFVASHARAESAGENTH
jgi:hypothetical protein